MNATTTARTAIDAYEARSRGRRLAALADRTADGAIAAGAVLLTNGVLPLGFNLPAGSAALSAGGVLLAAGLAWMRRPVRMPVRRPEPARGFSEPSFAAPVATVTALSARRAHHAAA